MKAFIVVAAAGIAAAANCAPARAQFLINPDLDQLQMGAAQATPGAPGGGTTTSPPPAVTSPPPPAPGGLYGGAPVPLPSSPAPAPGEIEPAAGN